MLTEEVQNFDIFVGTVAERVNYVMSGTLAVIVQSLGVETELTSSLEELADQFDVVVHHCIHE